MRRLISIRKGSCAGRRFIFPLLAGIIFGFGIALAVLQSNFVRDRQILLEQLWRGPSAPAPVNVYETDMTDQNYVTTTQLGENHTKRNETEGNHTDGTKRKVRLLCWISTCPKNHKKKAIHVKKTWGARCDELVFISSRTDKELGAIGLKNVLEGRGWLWPKTRGGLQYIWDNHRDDADWFLKADDDTYVVVENLKSMLKDKNPNDPLYFGARFNATNLTDGYMSGGAGYVLSKESLRRFVEVSLPDENKCPSSRDLPEDFAVGMCLKNVGVLPDDTRDTEGRYRFLPLAPSHHFLGNDKESKNWYWDRIYYPQKQGLDCCSDNVISFHYVWPSYMYLLEYLLYHAKVDRKWDEPTEQ